MKRILYLLFAFFFTFGVVLGISREGFANLVRFADQATGTMVDVLPGLVHESKVLTKTGLRQITGEFLAENAEGEIRHSGLYFALFGNPDQLPFFFAGDVVHFFRVVFVGRQIWENLVFGLFFFAPFSGFFLLPE